MIGRNLKKVIIVDNLKENFCWQKENGIQIKEFNDDPEDEELLRLADILTHIANSGTEDVRI